MLCSVGLGQPFEKESVNHGRPLSRTGKLLVFSGCSVAYQLLLETDSRTHVILLQLRSQVRCLECGNISVRFDPFTFLSLPLPMDSSIYVEVVGTSEQLVMVQSLLVQVDCPLFHLFDLGFQTFGAHNLS